MQSSFSQILCNSPQIHRSPQNDPFYSTEAVKPKDRSIFLIHTYAIYSIVLFFIRLEWFSSSFPWWKYQLVYSFWIMLYSITLNKTLTGFFPTIIYLIFKYQRAFLTCATCESFCLWTSTIMIITTNRNQLVVVTSRSFTWKFYSSKNIFKTRHNRLEKISSYA